MCTVENWECCQSSVLLPAGGRRKARKYSPLGGFCERRGWNVAVLYVDMDEHEVTSLPFFPHSVLFVLSLSGLACCSPSRTVFKGRRHHVLNLHTPATFKSRQHTVCTVSIGLNTHRHSPPIITQKERCGYLPLFWLNLSTNSLAPRAPSHPDVVLCLWVSQSSPISSA